MPAIRAPTIPSHLLGRRSRNDTSDTHPQSRIPAPAPTYKNHEHSNVYDRHARPLKAKFTANSFGLNTLYTISKASTKKTKPTKSILNSKFAPSQLSINTKLDALSQVNTDATTHTYINPYPHSRTRTREDHKFKIPAMPSLPFKVSKHGAPAHRSKHAVAYMPPKQHQLPRYQDDLDDDLEASFASNMSLHSPPHTARPLPSEEESRDYVPMDISPAPQRVLAHASAMDKHAKPIASSKTANQRSFGRDVSNVGKIKESGGKTSGGKKLARSTLPLEWMQPAKQPTAREDRAVNFPPTYERRDDSFVEEMEIPSSDGMDIDESFGSATASAPSPTCPLSAGSVDSTPFPSAASPPPPSSAVDYDSEPELEIEAQPALGGLFKNVSPARRGARRSLHEDSSMSMARSFDDSPAQPVQKKRRSFSPEPSVRRRQLALLEQDSLSSSPGLMSSPSVSKLERLQAKPLKALPLGHAEPPLNANNKRPRRLALSAMIPPADLLLEESLKTARPIMQGEPEEDESKVRRFPPPPVRRAFSAAYPAGMNLMHAADEADTSFSMDSDVNDVSSPAVAYAKRQQMKTIRRCDGMEDFRSRTGATAMLKREEEMRTSRKSPEGMPLERDTPRSKYLSAGGPRASGLGGFGDNEASGKILPCHRVKEDGLMRITCDTVTKLLDGAYDSLIHTFHVIDCRFDYEYNGGHIPGAVNINTTAGVEEFLLGTTVSKPKPSTSGDASKKTILVFHCEFSHKRAPTFAKHLRSRDRAINNHVYPNIHYPDVYILEGGYCEFYKRAAERCHPPAYVRMDDPHYADSRDQDLDQFRKGKFGRTKSYAYGDGKSGLLAPMQQPKRSSAPGGLTSTALFAAGNMARTRRTNGLLQTLEEDPSGTQTDDDDDTDIGDSPCPPPSKGVGVAFLGKKMARAPLMRAETYDGSRMALRY